MPLERRANGIVDSDGHFYPWSYFGVTPNAEVKKIKDERDALREAAKKQTRDAEEAARKERRTLTPTDPKASRWMRWGDPPEWRWCRFDPATGRLVDTGIRPRPGIALGLQKPDEGA